MRETRVGVAVFVCRDDAILMLRRSRNEGFMPGMYELPGGKLEFGEAPEDAVVREVSEETSLRVQPSRLVSARSYLSRDGKQHNVELFYVADVSPGDDVRMSREHEDFEWIRPGEESSLGLEDDDPILAEVRRYLTTRGSTIL